MVRTGLRLLLALFYFAAGVLHLKSPAGFLSITPGWVPFPEAVVAFTGVAEIAGAIGLLIPRVRKAAGIGLAIYALCVWPANFNHAINDISIGDSDLSWRYHGTTTCFPASVHLASALGRQLSSTGLFVNLSNMARVKSVTQLQSYRADELGKGVGNMHKDGDHIDVTEEEASGGVKNHGVRYVLAISLFLAIIVLSLMWMTGAVLN